MQLALEIGLNKCVVLKPFISEANWGGEKGSFVREQKNGTLQQWKRSCGSKGADLLRSRVMGILG